MNQDKLAAEAEHYIKSDKEGIVEGVNYARDEYLRGKHKGYTEGVYRGVEVGSAESETREQEAYEKGVAHGRVVARRVEWSKLFGVVVVGSVIGCGIILAVAVGLSRL